MTKPPAAHVNLGDSNLVTRLWIPVCILWKFGEIFVKIFIEFRAALEQEALCWNFETVSIDCQAL